MPTGRSAQGWRGTSPSGERLSPMELFIRAGLTEFPEF
jgi:hypothetical protein